MPSYYNFLTRFNDKSQCRKYKIDNINITDNIANTENFVQFRLSQFLRF